MSHSPLSHITIFGGIAAVNTILGKVRLDGKTVACDSTFGDRDIGSARAVILELLLQLTFCGVRLGEDQQTRGFPVKAVNDKKPLWRPLALHVIKKPSIKCPGLFFVGSDRQQTFRLVNNDEVSVLKYNLDTAIGS